MKYDIAFLPGDGIGPEVTTEARKVVQAAADLFGFGLDWKDLPFGAGYYLEHKEVLPKTGLDDIGACQAMMLGAVGDPRVPPGPLEQELLLALRFHFDQYLNLRPAQSFPNVSIPLSLPPGGKLDIMVVRENTEDFYMGLGGQGRGHLDQELVAKRGLYNLSAKVSLDFNPETSGAFCLGILSEPGTIRITRKAFQIAKSRGDKKIHVASKANALPQFYGFWDKITSQVAGEFGDIAMQRLNVDALCYFLPRSPMDYGVILCPNLFGDIVSDLVSALAGGLGLAASANIGDGLSMFEPVHGSAPDIAGTGRSNPLAAILSGALMLEHLGEKKASLAINQAVSDYLAAGFKLPFELGGQTRVEAIGTLVVDHLRLKAKP